MHPEYLSVRFRTDNAVIEWPESFAIITAFATTGEEWTEARNTEADKELESILRRRASWVVRITGYSPETGHAELGWAAVLSFNDACDLGLEFKQDAVYFIERDKLFVSHCDHRRELIFVGIFRQRLDDMEPAR